MTIDLDNRDNCADTTPEHCETGTCAATDDLHTCTLDTSLGVLCVTVCRKCLDADKLPRINIGAAARRVLDHCGHLGITLDEMSAQRRQENGEDAEVTNVQGDLR